MRLAIAKVHIGCIIKAVPKLSLVVFSWTKEKEVIDTSKGKSNPDYIEDSCDLGSRFAASTRLGPRSLERLAILHHLPAHQSLNMEPPN